jgi:hypothetical protein
MVSIINNVIQVYLYDHILFISFQTGSFVFVFEVVAGLKGESGEKRNVKINVCHSIKPLHGTDEMLLYKPGKTRKKNPREFVSQMERLFDFSPFFRHGRLPLSTDSP